MTETQTGQGGDPLRIEPATDDTLIEVPSGQPISLIETIWNAPGPDGLTVRFRFLAPQIERDLGRMTFIEAEADMAHLCEHYALPRMAGSGPAISQIIISLSDRILEFGEISPDATQFFEAYRPENGTCIWEGF
ncbi:DUF6497 family protein [Actibacterium ureilyticum]|uniref:DUF6497 family protein n=1 Tax=Actibacterium ureilyticum TaxID=1590614 RepID=UPI001FEA0CBF|nr:DUF6497 family protein [Actibacterium ureilyticum]